MQELLEEGITSEEIMHSYRVNLRSNQERQLQLSFPQTQETKGSTLNKEDIEVSKNFPAIPQVPFAHISKIDEQMSLLSVAQRIGNPTVIEQTIKDEITTQSSDFLHTVGLKALLTAISTLQPHISIQEAQPYVQLEDLLITNTQTMVTKLLQTSHIVYNAQVRKNTCIHSVLINNILNFRYNLFSISPIQHFIYSISFKILFFVIHT